MVVVSLRFSWISRVANHQRLAQESYCDHRERKPVVSRGRSADSETSRAAGETLSSHEVAQEHVACISEAQPVIIVVDQAEELLRAYRADGILQLGQEGMRR